MLTLRNETAEQHRLAEQQEFQQQMVRGSLPQADYIRWLGQMLHLHVALEEELEDLVRSRPTLAGLFEEDRRKVPALRRDLAHFGSPAEEPPLAATSALIEEIRHLAAVRPLALLGLYYVLEGSTNGSRYIARKVRPAYGLAPGQDGAAYLEPYGDDQPARWAAFKAEMDRLTFSTEELRELVAAARMTFDGIRLMGAALMPEVAGR
ncbi:MAG: biliverdin-producing heme oxygenase [Gemmatimonadales bacterium]